MKKDAAYFASLRWFDTKLRAYDGREMDGIRIVATSRKNAIARMREHMSKLPWIYSLLVSEIGASEVSEEVRKKYDLNDFADLESFRAMARG